MDQDSKLITEAYQKLNESFGDREQARGVDIYKKNLFGDTDNAIILTVSTAYGMRDYEWVDLRNEIENYLRDTRRGEVKVRMVPVK